MFRAKRRDGIANSVSLDVSCQEFFRSVLGIREKILEYPKDTKY